MDSKVKKSRRLSLPIKDEVATEVVGEKQGEGKDTYQILSPRYTNEKAKSKKKGSRKKGSKKKMRIEDTLIKEGPELDVSPAVSPLSVQPQPTVRQSCSF
jgi:hypothetical protein